MAPAWLHLFRLAAGCGSAPIFPGGPGLYDRLSCNGGQISITSVSDALKILGNVLRIAIAISGALAVAVILVGAIYYITSAGDAGRVKRAKDILTNTAVGLVLITVSYVVVTFIAGNF